MSGLDIAVLQQQSATVAVITGEVDLSNGLRLTDEILAQMPDQSRGLVLDLAGLDYLDSAGVRSIFEIARTLELRGQQLAIVVADNPPLSSVLKVTRVNEVAALCGARDEAVELVGTATGAAGPA